jgi:imidazolonepropionase-like amidohydrolase
LDPLVPDTPPLDASITAFVGGTVFPIVGPPIPDGVILVRDGIIDAVGAGLVVPPGARVIDAEGGWILPGLIDPHSHVGVHEESVGWAGADGSEVTQPNTAGVRAVDAVNIEDEGFRDALRGGVTTVVVKPGSGNPIGGQAVAMKTWGGRTVDEQVISDRIGVKSALGENPKRAHGDAGRMPSTRLGIAYVIRQAFLDAIAYRENRDAARAEKRPFAVDLAKEALVDVLSGELSWEQHAHRHDDIATALRLADEFGYRLVLNHGTEAHKLASLIAERNVPVIFGPSISSRSKNEVAESSIANLVILHNAGVTLAMTTDHPVLPLTYLAQQAALAVREGLPAEAAREMLTMGAASIAGISNRVGSIQPGLDADLVIWSGDPFVLTTRVMSVFISGQRVLHRVDGTEIIAERHPRSAETSTGE